jgi:putative tricarboxylic transport membrane protein
MKFLLRLLPLALLLAVHPCAAQSYPVKHIELVVHTGPGSGSDLVARTVAEIVAREKLLPQLLIVQNRAGGGGAIAQSYVAGKRGDPYVVLAAVASVVLSVPIRTGLDVGLDKFQPLGLIGVDLSALAVREDSPYRTMGDFVNAAKANPKAINIAVGSIGATGHYFVYQLERLTGARFNVVAMKTGTDAITAVLGGHVHAVSDTSVKCCPTLKGKKCACWGYRRSGVWAVCRTCRR